MTSTPDLRRGRVSEPDGRGAPYECRCGGLLAEDRHGPYCLDCDWRPQSKHTWAQPGAAS